MIFSLISGTTASMVHVVTGPDHLAAVTPLAIETRRRAWRVGMFWGVGHTVGVLLIGLLFLLFREVIPVEAISSHSEQLVGLMLIGIGVWALWKVFRQNQAHTHTHVVQTQRSNVIIALSVGIFHGLAGVSHLLGILPTLALPTRFDAALYLVGFAIGTIAAMIAYAFLLGFFSHRFDQNKQRLFSKMLRIGGGVLSILVGFLWIGISFGMIQW